MHTTKWITEDQAYELATEKAMKQINEVWKILSITKQTKEAIDLLDGYIDWEGLEDNIIDNLIENVWEKKESNKTIFYKIK